jgi:hypothetical protein
MFDPIPVFARGERSNPGTLVCESGYEPGSSRTRHRSAALLTVESHVNQLFQFPVFIIVFYPPGSYSYIADGNCPPPFLDPWREVLYNISRAGRRLDSIKERHCLCSFLQWIYMRFRRTSSMWSQQTSLSLMVRQQTYATYSFHTLIRSVSAISGGSICITVRLHYFGLNGSEPLCTLVKVWIIKVLLKL